jgi:TolB-like protein/tetratricopeptide (TPR) repeat protein/DNA-binding SARP family transcriptional activator
MTLSSARFRLRLLGRLELSIEDDAAPVRVSTRKAGALVAYLAMAPTHTANREELATLLWGGCSDQQARQSLRQALVLLRKDLRHPDVIKATNDRVQLLAEQWWVDACEFELLSRSADPAELARAAGLFGGDFLAGFNLDEEGFDEWAAGQRQRMQRAAARLCETYVARPELVADGEQAIVAVERLLGLDPLREDWQRLALTLYARYRGRNEALSHADGFAALLRRELAVGPERRTLDLVASIRDGAIVPSGDRGITAPVVPAASTAASPAPPLARSDNTQAPDAPDAASARAPRWPRLTGLAAAAAAVALGVVGLSHYYMAYRGEPVPAATTSPPQATTSPAQTSLAHASAAATDPWQSPSTPARARAPDGRSSGIVALAVLPFTTAGEGGESSSLAADLMADDLISVLSSSQGVRVISRQSSGNYRGVDPAAAGGELGVPYVISGSAEALGDRLRLHVDLIDTRNATRVWSGSFERAGSDRRGLQDEIVNGLGRELNLAVMRIENLTTDSGTHRLIINGWNALHASATAGREPLKRAEARFTEALARDPENPRAQTGLAAYHVLMAVQLLAPDPGEHLQKAEAILHRLIAQHPNSGQVHYYLGVAHIARGERNDATGMFEKAVALDPSLAPAYAQLGRMLTGAGNPEQGLKHIHYAMRLSPRDPSIAYWLGFAGTAELERRNYPKAIEYLDRAIDLHPKQPRNMLVRAAAYALSGNIGEARVQLQAVRKAHPHLSGEATIERFFAGRQAGPGLPHLKEGLRLALSAPDPWQSPGARAGHDPAPRRDIIPIAILPFTAHGEPARPGEGTQLIADMLTDDLINLLSRNRAFRVISRATARSYKDRSADLASIGAELQVRYVLEGSVRTQADKLRVNVELIDSASRTAVWSGRIERDGADQLGVQDEIVGRLARELHFEILPLESERHRDDPSAVALVYRAWAAMNAAFARTGGDSFKKAEALFREALERDPGNLQATIGLGAYHANIGAQALAADSKAHLEQAREILTGVLARAPGNGQAPFYLGLVYGASGRLDDALASFQRAVEINPSHASAHAHIGHALARMERAAEGLEHLRYAMRLSPRDPNLSYWFEFVGAAELALDHYDKAIESFARSNAINPGYPRSLAGLAAAHALVGNMAEARKYADRLRAFVQQSDPEVLIRRFGRGAQQAPRLHEGLRLALAPATEMSRLPGTSQ